MTRNDTERNDKFTLNSRELSEIIKISERRIQQLAQQGKIPTLNNGKKPYAFDARVAVSDYYGNEIDELREKESTYKEDIDKYKSQLLCIEVSKKTSEVIDVSCVIQAWSIIVSDIARSQKEIPARISTKVRQYVSSQDSDAIIRLFEQEIRNSHTELSKAPDYGE